ncbi:hypothetical protein A9Q83_02580 [Alphaproteobacteria bacterium 46_93_T64]|nr:hypothetical protein A9Q83_02580 [Alphaproteobacteria bacterium 46_93_T64]
MISKIINFFGESKFQKTRFRALIAVLILVVIADILVTRDHGDFFWDYLPAWSAGFGFVSCVLIIFVSKAIGHQGRIMQDEDYYD